MYVCTIYGCESKCKAPIHTLNPQADPYPRSISTRRWSRPIHIRLDHRGPIHTRILTQPHIYIYMPLMDWRLWIYNMYIECMNQVRHHCPWTLESSTNYFPWVFLFKSILRFPYWNLVVVFDFFLKYLENCGDFLMSAPGFPRVRGVFWAAFRAGQSQGDCQKCLFTGACNLGDLIHDRCNMIYWLVVWNHEILWLSIYCIGNKNPNWKYQGNTRKIGIYDTLC